MTREGMSLYVYYQSDGYTLQYIEFTNGVGNDSTRRVSARNNFKDLFTTLLGECNLKTSIENKQAFELCLTHGAMGALEPVEVKLLEALVDHHNYEIERQSRRR